MCNNLPGALMYREIHGASASNTRQIEDLITQGLIDKVHHGTALGDSERQYLRDKLNAAKIPYTDEYVPTPISSMSAMDRFRLERQVSRR
jgi:hypothetical protein